MDFFQFTANIPFELFGHFFLKFGDDPKGSNILIVLNDNVFIFLI